MGQQRCVLHIGTMKTATTTIQAWLERQAGWLATRGWVYPGWPHRAERQFQDTIRALAPEDNLVVSDEGLWHYSASPRSRTRQIAEMLAGFDVTVIVYCRRPDQFLESWFKQGIKNGSGQHDLPAFLALPATRAAAFRQKLDLFAGVFGAQNLIVAPYERAQLIGGGIVADFLARTGLPVPDPAASRTADGDSRNISPGADVMLLAGLMRRAFNIGQPEIDAVLASSPHGAVAHAGSSVFSPDEVAAIRADYRPLFHDIQQRFGSGAAPDFFLDWGDTRPDRHPSPLRVAYDAYMAMLAREQGP